MEVIDEGRKTQRREETVAQTLGKVKGIDRAEVGTQECHAGWYEARRMGAGKEEQVGSGTLRKA